MVIFNKNIVSKWNILRLRLVEAQVALVAVMNLDGRTAKQITCNSENERQLCGWTIWWERLTK